MSETDMKLQNSFVQYNVPLKQSTPWRWNYQLNTFVLTFYITTIFPYDITHVSVHTSSHPTLLTHRRHALDTQLTLANSNSKRPYTNPALEPWKLNRRSAVSISIRRPTWAEIFHSHIWAGGTFARTHPLIMEALFVECIVCPCLLISPESRLGNRWKFYVEFSVLQLNRCTVTYCYACVNIIYLYLILFDIHMKTLY